MSRVVYCCTRQANSQTDVTDRDISTLNARLSPDNVAAHPAQLVREFGIVAAVLNPSEALTIRGLGICAGGLFGPHDDWWIPGTPAPDGTYALFRANADVVELLTDAVGTRTIWYAQTPESFFASTSQRALVALLGSFERNEGTVSWMLSAGCLGPDQAWDARIRPVPPNACLRLERASWTVSLTGEEIRFDAQPRAHDDHRKRLEEALQTTFDRLGLDPSRWVLPLSGGFDSRSILLMMNERARLRCITWGLRSSLDDPQSDSAVAARLAERLGVSHSFCPTDSGAEAFNRVFERFLVAGEGRVDGIGGYTDGFAIWKRLFEDDVAGIIRGDEGFGWQEVLTPFDVRRSVGCMTVRDFANLAKFGAELPAQSMPEHLRRRPGESLATWRDRLYHGFRIPVVLAGLNDLKCAYVELVNPLLSREILLCVRELPDELRTDKRLFREIVLARNPDIPFATHLAIARPENILRAPATIELLRAELSSAAGDGLLAPGVANTIRGHLTVPTAAGRSETSRSGLSAALRSALKRPITLARSYLAKPHADWHVVAFRACIASRMSRLLSADASILKPGRTSLR